MIKKYWRPENWKNLYSQMVRDFPDRKTKIEAAITSKVFEVGADAMLKALLFHLSLYCEHDDPPIPKRKYPICWRLLSG